MMGERIDDDVLLVVRVARGDGAAFGVLYGRYLPLVLRWCLRQTGNRELAADLTAEVFAAALIASPRYQAGRGSVGAWLLGIANNKLRESQRRRRVENAARRRLGIGPLTLTDEALERVEELASLDSGMTALLETLPEDQREAVVQRVIAERSYEDIADELRCSASVVRQRVSRGLRTMRSELEER
jgi:RNA polymerase sigma-70 factor (ECF subfamily)